MASLLLPSQNGSIYPLLEPEPALLPSLSQQNGAKGYTMTLGSVLLWLCRFRCALLDYMPLENKRKREKWPTWPFWLRHHTFEEARPVSVRQSLIQTTKHRTVRKQWLFEVTIFQRCFHCNNGKMTLEPMPRSGFGDPYLWSQHLEVLSRGTAQWKPSLTIQWVPVQTTHNYYNTTSGQI